MLSQEDCQAVLVHSLEQHSPNDGMAAVFVLPVAALGTLRYRFRQAAAELGVKLLWDTAETVDGRVKVWVKARPKLSLDKPSVEAHN